MKSQAIAPSGFNWMKELRTEFTQAFNDGHVGHELVPENERLRV